MLDCGMMETFSQLAALCRSALSGGPWFDGTWAIASLPASLFLAGLVGGALHCAGMCGPFVLSQVMVDAERTADARYGEWRRLAGAALVPYHLGRLTTYTLLGAVAGSVTALFAATATFGWLSGGLLVLAAGLMVAQALGLTLGSGRTLPNVLARPASRLSTGRHAATRYALGVVLGFLPCGLLYGALAAAAGAASTLEGAAVMAAFALGTAPALLAVGWGGLIVRRRLRETTRWFAAPLLLANAGVMLVLASQRW
ncbi:MAG: sulfite exporter TauE/SafE family protein [Reyranella sp.]|uniref:sulfite exporter TauE/SafE family protein n=1 Tax=Reyranella sp. TaxID=1929291 RepID=UPI003D13C700